MNEHELQVERDKERAAEDVKKSLAKSDIDLLNDIFHTSINHISQNSATNTSRTIAHFSALLVNLSIRSEESTKRTVNLTNQLRHLTWALFFLTLVLVGFEVRDYFTQPQSNPKQSESHIQQPKENKKSTKPIVPAINSQTIPPSNPPERREPVGNNKQLSNPTLNQTTNRGVELGKVNNKERDN
jgi:hypothetical protein